MNLYEAFESNLVDEPKTFPLSDTSDISMLPVGGDKAKRAFENMMGPYAARLKAGGELTDEENKTLNVKFYSQYIVTGWSGMKGRDKELIPYSKENAAKLFADPKLARFFALIIKMAANDAAFEAEQAEADAGN